MRKRLRQGVSHSLEARSSVRVFESQRDSATKPRVARTELPWAIEMKSRHNPNGVAPVENGYGATPLGLAGPGWLHSCSLLYRRFLTCLMSPASNVLPIPNRRYGRLKICATLNGYLRQRRSVLWRQPS
jgi:hypothetical protein